jgi:hypothetical protein
LNHAPQDLKASELRVELQNLGLSTTGTKRELERRMEAEGHMPWSAMDFVTTTKSNMTFAQEFANAVSMMVPSLVVIHHYHFADPAACFWSVHTKAVGGSALLHLPFSFSYHLMCAFDCYEDRVDCVGRKLDQTFIHVASALCAFGLSGGDGLYTAGMAILQTWYIAKLWMPGVHDNSFERRSNVFLSVILYTLPMFWRGDHANFFRAFVGSFMTGASAFAFNRYFYGWGHSTSHVVLGVFMHCLLASASMIPDSTCAISP